MKKLYVYADFDWLKDIELVGELGYESLRGSDSYSFRFADSWMKKYNANETNAVAILVARSKHAVLAVHN